MISPIFRYTPDGAGQSYFIDSTVAGSIPAASTPQVLSEKELGDFCFGVAALWQRSDCRNCPFSAALGTGHLSSIRYIAERSLRTLPGYEDFEYDFVHPTKVEVAVPKQLPEGVPAGRINALLNRRDDRPMKLAE